MGRALQGACPSRSTTKHCIFTTGYPRSENTPLEVDPPTLDEVCTANRQLRNDRAPGEDGIQAEVFKTCRESLGPWLHQVITKVWLCEAVP